MRGCAAILLFAAFLAPAAHAAGPALALPTFQELLTPPAPASAPAAASTPAVDDAEMVRSLDSIITTLDSDKQRAALVAQLKKLRDAKREAEAAVSQAPAAVGTTPASDGASAPAAASASAAQTPASSAVAAIAQNAGLLGAIASV